VASPKELYKARDSLKRIVRRSRAAIDKLGTLIIIAVKIELAVDLPEADWLDRIVEVYGEDKNG